MSEKKRYRVIQWATGNIGTCALSALIHHPDMELVGVYVTSPEKVGMDAGKLCGLGKDVGIKATSSVEDIIATDADCVLYMPPFTDFDEVCRLLEAGKNIITPRGEFLYPGAMKHENRSRVEAACVKGGTSIHSTGGSPGFITEVLPIALLAQQRRVNCLTINEFGDMSSRNSPDMIFKQMGFGGPASEFSQAHLDYTKNDFAGSFKLLADGMNLHLDDVTVIGETALATQDVEIVAGKIRKGTVAGMRITVSGMRKGEPLLRFRAHWYCGRDLDQDWGEMLYSGWKINMEGDTPMDVCITFPVSAEEYPLFTPRVTAHPVINIVPALCAAKPGIRTTMDLPKVLPVF